MLNSEKTYLIRTLDVENLSAEVGFKVFMTAPAATEMIRAAIPPMTTDFICFTIPNYRQTFCRLS